MKKGTKLTFEGIEYARTNILGTKKDGKGKKYPSARWDGMDNGKPVYLYLSDIEALKAIENE